MEYSTVAHLRHQVCPSTINTLNRMNSLLLLPFKSNLFTVKILKFGTPQTIAIIVLKIEKFDVTLH